MAEPNTSDLGPALADLRRAIDRLIDEQREACFAAFEEVLGGKAAGGPTHFGGPTPPFTPHQVTTPGGDPALITQLNTASRPAGSKPPKTPPAPPAPVDVEKRLNALADRLRADKARERNGGHS